MKSSKNLHTLEKIITISQFVIFLCLGIIQAIPQTLLHEFKALFPILHNVTLSMTESKASVFLQVDATILTLSIALIALISGLISDSHMGISYSDYYLNIRPRIYKEIVIIILSLIYFGVGTVCYWIGFNYLVAAVLLCEILLILMSTISIYGIFSGKDKVRKEIEDYLVLVQTTVAGSHTAFIDAFAAVLTKGDKGEFEVYLNTFLRITDYVWRNRNIKGADNTADTTAYDWETYRRNCCKLLNICAEAIEHQSKLFYLRLADSIYEYLFGLIKEEKCSQTHTSNERHRFDIIDFYSFCNGIIRKISITEFENTLGISSFLYRMMVVDLVLFRDYHYDVGWTPPAIVFSIQSALGQYIAEQHSKGNLADLDYWTKIFNLWYVVEDIRKFEYIDYVSESDKMSLTEAFSNGEVLFACGLLLHFQFDTVKKGLYGTRLSTLLPFRDDEVRTVLAVHGYLYYMAYCESVEVVGDELQRRAREFLKDPDVLQVYREFITNNKVDGVLIDNLRSEWRIVDSDNGGSDQASRAHDKQSRKINILLHRFDLRMGGRGMQRLILSEVIDDFCLFTILFLSYNSLSNLDWLGDEFHNIEDYIQYVSTGNDVEERLKVFIQFMNADILKDEKLNSDRRKKCVNQAIEINDILQTTIKQKYKEKKIKEAREKEAEYLKNHDLIEEKRIGWIRDIYKDIRDRFGSLINIYPPTSGTYVTFKRVELFNYSTYTNMIDDKLDRTDLGRIATRLIDVFIRQMKQNGCIKFMNRETDFIDDQDYANYLKNNNLNIMLGSELLLGNNDFRKSESFNEATKDFTWIKAFGGFYAAAIEKGSVVLYIKDLKANIRPDSLECEYLDQDQSSYDYEPIMGVSIPFDREELSEFLHNERKIVEVTAEIGIQVYKSNAGIYFESQRKPIEY